MALTGVAKAREYARRFPRFNARQWNALFLAPTISMTSGGSVPELAANGTEVARFALSFGTPNFILEDNGVSHAMVISADGILTKSGTLDFETEPLQQVIVHDVTSGVSGAFNIDVTDSVEATNFTNESALLGALAI